MNNYPLFLILVLEGDFLDDSVNFPGVLQVRNLGSMVFITHPFR